MLKRKREETDILDELRPFIRVDDDLSSIPSREKQVFLLRKILKRERSTSKNKYNLRNKIGIFGEHKCTTCDKYYSWCEYHPSKPSICRTCCDHAREKNRIVFQVKTNELIKLYSNEIESSNLDVGQKRRMIDLVDRSLRQGWITVYKLFCSNGVLNQYECLDCKESKYLSEFAIEWRNARGFRRICTSCRKNNRTDIISIKSRMMEKRSLRYGFYCVPDAETLFRHLFKKQKGRCIYTMIEFDKTPNRPYTPSPERILRDKGYSYDNTVLCLQILNCGQALDWTRRLTLQIYFADQFPLEHDIKRSSFFIKGSKHKSYLSKKLHKMKSKAKERAANKNRYDNSGEFNVTYDELVDIMVGQNFRCALSNLPLMFESYSEWALSHDRIDPKRGYVKDNIRFTIVRLNQRETWSDDSFGNFKNEISKNIELLIEIEGLINNVVKKNKKYILKNKSILMP